MDSSNGCIVVNLWYYTSILRILQPYFQNNLDFTLFLMQNSRIRGFCIPDKNPFLRRSAGRTRITGSADTIGQGRTPSSPGVSGCGQQCPPCTVQSAAPSARINTRAVQIFIIFRMLCPLSGALYAFPPVESPQSPAETQNTGGFHMKPPACQIFLNFAFSMGQIPRDPRIRKASASVFSSSRASGSWASRPRITSQPSSAASSQKMGLG